MLLTAQVIVSIILIVLVLIQERAGGLGSLFGGASSTPYQTRRGVEKIAFIATIILAILFGVIAILNLIAET
jgi:protein translocase SecG subunit